MLSRRLAVCKRVLNYLLSLFVHLLLLFANINIFLRSIMPNKDLEILRSINRQARALYAFGELTVWYSCSRYMVICDV